jgi:hypothetical protein
MVLDDSLALSMEVVIRAIEAGLPGHLAEFGTWKGVASFAMLLIQRERSG